MQKIELNHEELDFRSREAFRTLRTNIEFSGDDVKVICLTSCTPNEGKSDTSFELARAFAQNGKKVLLIDADLRKSVMRHRHKKGKVRLGLVNYLVGRASMDDVLCATDIRNFTMYFAGRCRRIPVSCLEMSDFGRWSDRRGRSMTWSSLTHRLWGV